MGEPESRTITSDQIDTDFTPQPGSTVEQAMVGGDLVLVDGWRAASVLGPTGVLVWGSFDGASTVEAIVDELVAATGGARGAVESEVLAFTRHMGDLGYLEGVRPPDPGQGDLGLVEVFGLGVGEEVDDCEVLTVAGEPGTLSGLRGRSVLLVNWSPHCGYCSAIADLLAVLVVPLRGVGIEVVLLASGGLEANLTVTDTAGYRGELLLRQGDVDPFRAYGTPSAYLLDADGRLVEPMAGGAEAVLALAASLAGTDPYSLLDDTGSDPVPPGTRYLLTDGACDPLAAGGPSVTWSGINAYRVGSHHVGIRYDTETTASVLDALFEGRRVRDRRAGHSYAVSLGLGEGGTGVDAHERQVAGGSGVRGLCLLVAGGASLVRSRYPSRVLRALLWRLSDDTLGFDVGPGRLRVQATAAVLDGRAVLLPSQLHVFGPSMQARLAGIGLAVADPPFPEIDLHTAELVIPVPGVDHDGSVLELLGPTGQVRGELAPVLPGRYPLLGWGVLHPSDSAVTRFSPAEAAAATLSLVYETDDAARRLGELGDLFSRVQGFGLWYASEAGLVDAVARAMSGDAPDGFPW